MCWEVSRSHEIQTKLGYRFDGLVQQRHNSSANALELRLSCTNPSVCLLPQQSSLASYDNTLYNHHNIIEEWDMSSNSHNVEATILELYHVVNFLQLIKNQTPTDLTHWPLGKLNEILYILFSNGF